MHVAILFLFQLQVGVPVIECVSMTVNVTDDIIASSATSGGNISLYTDVFFAEAEIVLENKIKIKTKNKINFFIPASC
jgi:hypothetical protein